MPVTTQRGAGAVLKQFFYEFMVTREFRLQCARRISPLISTVVCIHLDISSSVNTVLQQVNSHCLTLPELRRRTPTERRGCERALTRLTLASSESLSPASHEMEHVSSMHTHE
ncbi:unnamed protein product [Leuciscus chuanchicus]